MSVLLTGGGGYIGSHVAARLLETGSSIVIVDNKSTSAGHNVAVLRDKFGSGFVELNFDVSDADRLSEAIERHGVRAIMHFAGYKSVAESVVAPLTYFENNIASSLSVLKAMRRTNVSRLVFSSSATVYGEPLYLPLDEQHPRAAVNPYGKSKQMIEEIIEAVVPTIAGARAINLRYFNPIGYHPSLDLREDGSRLGDNLVPHILAAFRDEDAELAIFGDDYDTRDGTAIRDYLHVMDVADGHEAALRHIENMAPGVEAVNLGRGCGVTVKELVETFERLSGRELRKRNAPRRPGDVAAFYADAEKAGRSLGWVARRSVDCMVVDSLKDLPSVA